MDKKYAGIIICLLMVFGLGKLAYNTIQYYRIIPILKAKIPQDVTVTIYPRVSLPVGRSVRFTYPDPLVSEFWSALTDIRRYWPNHDTVNSQEHSWFGEIFAENGNIHIQIDFHIPSHKNDVVAGELGTFHGTSHSSYGEFQSSQLYQWYQKYSHRWLKPGGAQPTPTPQPEPLGGE